MQYMDWPDHGIPDSTKNIVNFCHQMRKRWENERGMAVVHCRLIYDFVTLIGDNIILNSIFVALVLVEQEPL